MFYLIEFFKSLGESLIRGWFFFFFSCLFAFSLTHRSWIAQTVEKITPEKIVFPYVIAVLDDQISPENIKSVVGKFPGVLGVVEKSSEENNKKISSLLNDLGSEYKLDPSLMNFKTIRITLNPALSKESMDYVRGEVVRIGGKEHMNVSQVNYPEIAGIMKSHPFYRFVSRVGDWGVIGVFGLFWIVSFWLCYNNFRSRSYLIEKFQRKKLVASKMVATGLALVYVLFTGLGLLNGTLKFFDLVILFMVFSVMWTFLMQDWRWKINQ